MLKRISPGGLFAFITLSAAGVAALAFVWKFGLEEWLDPFLPGDHATDSRAERWEFVVASSVLSALAMVLPAMAVYRLLEERLRVDRLASVVFNAAPQPMVVTDSSRCVISVNPAFEQLTGIAATSIMGQPIAILESDLQDADYYERMSQTLETTGKWSGEIRNRRPDGSLYVVWLDISTTRDVLGRVCEYVGVLTDVTWRKEKEEAALHLAMHDPLTGLANRRMLIERLNQVIASARVSAETVALLFIDLDGFKAVNDTLGHAAGDEVLRIAATRLMACARSADLVARFAGDEFVVLLRDVVSRDAVATVARRCTESLADPIAVNDQQVVVGASIGAAISSPRIDSADALLKLADASMYEVKRAGRGAYRIGETGDGAA